MAALTSEEKQNFKFFYLGIMVTFEGGRDKDVDRRLGKANTAFGRMNNN